MAHSSHAHPWPDGRHVSSGRPPAPSYASCTITSPPSALASQTQSEGLSQQTRRLQLRNTGFRGPALPFRRISPLFGASANAIEPFTRPVNNENSPSSLEKPTLYGENLPPSPVNILQEIHHISTRRKRDSSRPSFGGIFEDNVGKEEVNDARETSWYNEGSNNCSPAVSGTTPAKMNQLQELSLNQRTPPSLSSPLVKHVKGRTSTRNKMRSASSEAAKHIEHLESELASALAKLDSQPSPKTIKLRSAKLRTLTSENRNLKHENFEWEKRFDERVQEERDKRLEADMELRTRMRILEDELEMKDVRVGELEWELESMQVRLRDLEGLELSNVGLEKRIETLTNLLVQSPTKLDISSTSTSPIRRDPSKRTPRPRSMLPRVPSSPGGLRLSLPTVSESAYGRSKSLGSAFDVVESPDDVAHSGFEDDIQSPTCNDSMASPDMIRQSGSFDGRSRASVSFRSAPSSASRPTSIRSSCSFGPVSWGSPEHEARSAIKQRKMRRFPSGSSSLRPLILPTATVVPSLPASAPVYPSIEAIAPRDISDVSLDPTTAFLSSLADSSPISTPNQSRRQRSTTWVQEQTLKALEGEFKNSNLLGGECARTLGSVHPQSEEQSMGFREIPSDKRRRRSRPRSLQKELEEAEVNHLAGSQTEAGSLEAYEDGLIPVDVDNESCQVIMGMDPTPSRAPLSISYQRQRQLAMDTDITPKANHQQVQLAFRTPEAVKAISSTTLTSEHAHGIFFRLTNIISHTRQDPFVLARRLLSNAWALGSKRLGGMGWWLLGLVYGTRWRKRKRRADSGIVDSDSTKDFDWQHFSPEASKSRTAEHYFRDYGDTSIQNRESWLSPPHVSHRTSDSRRAVPPQIPLRNSGREPHLFPCEDCVEPSSRRTLRLWFQFSLAIVLAVGMAVKNGPGFLLVGDPPRLAYQRESEPLLHRQRERQNRQATDPSPQPSRESHDTNGADSGYGSITFAETLGPVDFQSR